MKSKKDKIEFFPFFKLSPSVKEMMFSKQEVTEIMDGLKDKITNQMDKEISYYLNMNGKKTNLIFYYF